jgi:hypothetical protein
MRKLSTLLFTFLIAATALADSHLNTAALTKVVNKSIAEAEQNNPPALERTGDACTEPLIVSELPYQFFGTTDDNSNTYGNSAPDEWHLVTILDEGPYMFTLCGGGTDYDSYIYLLDGDCSTELASNDDACGLVSEMEVMLDPGEYAFCVDGYSSYSGDYQLDIYGIEPPEYYNCQYPPHTPDDGWSAGTSHDNGDDIYYLRADRFGDAGSISGFVVAGLSLVYDSGWNDCSEDPMSFEIVFYEDGVWPGDEVCSYMLSASPVPTGETYAGYPLNEYYFYLPVACELEQGWFSVQSIGECWFLWLSAPDVDGMSALSTGSGWDDYGYDLAWCLTSDLTELDTPATIALYSNYPNPFNPVTTISYDLAEPQQVVLDVFNVSGDKVAKLVSGTQIAGEHTVEFDGSNLPSGIYFYRLTAGEFSKTNRMLLVK